MWFSLWYGGKCGMGNSIMDQLIQTHTPAGVFRRNYSEVLAEKAAPTIPVQPISYADAIHFMRCMCKHYHTGIICMHIACPFSSHLFDPFSFLIFSLVNFPLFLSFQPAGWEWGPSLMAGTTGYHLLHHTGGDQSVKVSQRLIWSNTWKCHVCVNYHRLGNFLVKSKKIFMV